MNLSVLSQPSLKGSRVLPGHILVNSKFQGCPIIKLVQENGVTPVIQDDLNVVDFYPSNKIAVVWIPEESITSDMDSVLKRLKKLSEGSCDGIALVQLTEICQQYYKKLQSSLLEYPNIQLIPVQSTNEMVKMISHLVYSQSHSNAIHTCTKSGINLDECLVATLRAFPSIGEKKALDLIKRFSSIHQIEQATLHELETIVGRSSAAQIRTFLDGKRQNDI